MRVPHLTTLCAPQGCFQSSTSLHTLCVPHVSQTPCALQLYIYIFTNCAPQVSQQMVPHSGISSTPTQTVRTPHVSQQNYMCPICLTKLCVPHMSHKTMCTPYASQNYVYPICLTKLCVPHMSHNKTMCTPHVSQNYVSPTCLTKLCVPHMSHNKTMCTPYVSQQNYVYPVCLTKLCVTHVSQQNYVYPICLTTKLCVLHMSRKNLGPTVVPHSSTTHHTLCVCACSQTPRAAFQHLPPNSATTGYTTEGALSTSAQLSTDTVGPLRERSEY